MIYIYRSATVLYVPLWTVFCHLHRLVPLFISGPMQQLAGAGHVMAIITRKKSHTGKLLWETNKNNVLCCFVENKRLRSFLVRHCLVTLLISQGLVCSSVFLLTEEIQEDSSVQESCQYLHVLGVYVHRHTCWRLVLSCMQFKMSECFMLNPLNDELNPICYLLALLAHHFLHISRIRVKSLTLRLLMSYIYGVPILDVSRSHTTTRHSR
jgi:hypothetical protein